MSGEFRKRGEWLSAGLPQTADASGAEIKALAERLYPICRSITGNGVRETLDILGEHLPLERHEVPSGTPVFDWQIPPEWNIREAWVKDAAGRRVIDFRDSNLHVVNYSTPVRRTVSRDELAEHVFTLPDRPDWIPYRTTYYKRDWGFCLSENQWQGLRGDQFEVMIDSSLQPGALTLAECVLPGRSDREVLLSTHICHPSLCNDNLSGIAVQTHLMRWLAGLDRKYTYRAVFVPGTIGSLSWLWLNRDRLDRIAAGLVLCGLGDRGGFTYKRSRRAGTLIDRAAEIALRDSGEAAAVRDFSPYGYDERQYCSPGFNLPVGRLSRTPFGEYPEYHTSADNLEFVSESQLGASLAFCQRVIRNIEANDTWENLSPCGEPQLGKRGLYDPIGGTMPSGDFRMALLWMLNLSDGTNDMLAIAERSGLGMNELLDAASRLADAGLLRPATQGRD